MSILRPVEVGHITQKFDGDFHLEKPGYIMSGLPAARARPWPHKFPGSTYRLHLHKAIDYGVPIGTPVLAVADGVIVAQGQFSNGETWLMLRVKRGPKWQVIAFYTHLKSDSFQFATKAAVKRGQIVALSGNTGNSTGPHLHFELRRGSRGKDPRNSFKKWTRFDPQPFIDGTALTTLM